MNYIVQFFNTYKDHLGELYTLKRDLMMREGGLDNIIIDSNNIKETNFQSYNQKNDCVTIHFKESISQLINVNYYYNPDNSWMNYFPEEDDYLESIKNNNPVLKVYEIRYPHSLRNAGFKNFMAYEKDELTFSLKTNEKLINVNWIEIEQKTLRIIFSKDQSIEVYDNFSHLYDTKTSFINVKINTIEDSIRRKIEKNQKINVSNDYFNQVMILLEEDFKIRIDQFIKNSMERKQLIKLMKLYGIKKYSDISNKINCSNVLTKNNLELLDLFFNYYHAGQHIITKPEIKELSASYIDYMNNIEYVEKLKALYGKK